MRLVHDSSVLHVDAKREPSLLALRILGMRDIQVGVNLRDNRQSGITRIGLLNQLLQKDNLKTAIVIIVLSEIGWTCLSLQLNVF